MQTSSHAVWQQYGSTAQVQALTCASSQVGVPGSQQACGPAAASRSSMSSKVARFETLDPEEKRNRTDGSPASAARSSCTEAHPPAKTTGALHAPSQVVPSSE